MSMIEVEIASIFVSLMHQSKVIILKEVDGDRYIPIFTAAEMAEAINLGLEKVSVPRPMTHDLLNNVITRLQGTVSHVVVSALADSTFHALINLDVKGKHLAIDARTTDALALAVRTDVRIFVEEAVMVEAAIKPEAGIDLSQEGEKEDLDAFDDFIGSLDLDDL